MNSDNTTEYSNASFTPAEPNANDSPITSYESRLDSLQLSEQIQSELIVLEPEIPNIALDEAELATLNSLIKRYDQVIQELDLLNDQIENLLSEESIKGCDS
ncbi:MAG: hypothetical protein ACK5PB_23570 [Pirellula sp.]|jgi:hypothetical protein